MSMAHSSPLVARRTPRPRRGPPEETRARLVQAAAELFNRDGYDGTNSNHIARAAGYAPGVFYKHFTDKREIFLVVYADLFAHEWREVIATIDAAGTPAERAARIIDRFLAHHRRWRGFRASLRLLILMDKVVRDFYRSQRRQQLELLAGLRRQLGQAGSPESDTLLLFTLERAADAFAEGEPEALKIRPDVLRQQLVDLVQARLEPQPRRPRSRNT
jgi:AcrR family transcriptional regulator